MPRRPRCRAPCPAGRSFEGLVQHSRDAELAPFLVRFLIAKAVIRIVGGKLRYSAPPSTTLSPNTPGMRMSEMIRSNCRFLDSAARCPGSLPIRSPTRRIAAFCDGIALLPQPQGDHRAHVFGVFRQQDSCRRKPAGHLVSSPVRSPGEQSVAMVQSWKKRQKGPLRTGCNDHAKAAAKNRVLSRLLRSSRANRPF